MRITEQMKERIIKVASLYLSDKKCTIRDIAKMVGVSKTTAHLDLTIRLKEIDIRLYRKVKLKRFTNKIWASIRGGEATKTYWINKRKEVSADLEKKNK